MTLCLGGSREDLIHSFGKLQESPEWQYAGTCRAQIALIVQTLHFDPMKISFSMIAGMSGKSKWAIYKKYEKSQAQAHGQPFLLSKRQVEAIGVFVLECFEKGTPVTDKMIAHFYRF
jgi:hypothetical protein